MPSSITLTVSHLPRSTSFFLSVLQPLDYMYRGRTENTIGFGSSLDLSSPPDFWITQEVPGVPSGAAHVAFPASSHRKVEWFFTAALKAGGRTHGEPAIRDESGYYSAAVIDFDGNSIEAVYRPSYSDDKENAVAKSTVSRASRTKSERSFRERAHDKVASGDILDNIFAEVRSAADLARKAMQHVRPTPISSRSEPIMNTHNSSDSSKAVISTLLGVAAGAAITYAFNTSDDRGDRSDVPSRSSASRDKTYSRHSGALSDTKSMARSQSSRRGSATSDHGITVDEIEYRSTRLPPNRRHSTSIIPSTTARDNRSAFSSGSGSDRSRFRPIRMIEGPPASAYHSTSPRSERGSQSSTIRPHKHAASGSEKSNKGKSYPPSAYPTGYPTPPSSVSTARPLPPSRSNSTYHSTRDRPSSRARTSVRPEEYPLPPSRQGSSVFTGVKNRSGRDGSKRHSIMDEELRPEDSISQVSFNGNRSSSRRRR